VAVEFLDVKPDQIMSLESCMAYVRQFHGRLLELERSIHETIDAAQIPIFGWNESRCLPPNVISSLSCAAGSVTGPHMTLHSCVCAGLRLKTQIRVLNGL
jgi:hypothetical protein